MPKIGVLGAGHLGKIHIKLIKEIPEWDLVGFYDPDDTAAESAIAAYNIKRFESIDSLLKAVDAIDIVTPTLSHFELAERAIKLGKHIFIEKPLTNTLEEARLLVELVDESGVKAQVGHVERFNPAFLAVKDRDLNPMFIEAHRLAQFNPRGTDVAVILDLMIHDIDIILSVVKSKVKRISASGVAVVSNTPDIANARIEFVNGCVANITASRISLKQMRKMRLFQKDAYIAVDFLKKKSDIFTMHDAPLAGDMPLAIEVETGAATTNKYIHFETPEIAPINAIKMELELFAECIMKDLEPPVTVSDGYNSISIAHQILEKIEKNQLV